jgi:hypothetical protein
VIACSPPSVTGTNVLIPTDTRTCSAPVVIGRSFGLTTIVVSAHGERAGNDKHNRHKIAQHGDFPRA